ncbi:c-type cytochrome [Billgrantia endophytica]|uniref:Cytochrome c domain-containing protein n=1 Tax=Billgrantia endophytica TaxID=2033802 RepID=A0A2N7U552_9GAMM|nr:c-type cytochrome [Halomonas endophytica]PMR75544.1 hypothetical protein C1H69_10005 [Halomonas endophytica]
MSIKDRKRPSAQSAPSDSASSHFHFAALLVGSLALSFALANTGHAAEPHDHHGGGHSHPSHTPDGYTAHGNEGRDDDDHSTHGDGGHGWKAPQEWAERESPLEPDADTLAWGEQVYQRYCSACHGLGGDGNGPAAIAGLDPSPTNLALHGAGHRVGEYAWLVREGSPATAMPGFKETLGDDDVWSVVLYIRHELAKDDGGQAHQH